MTDSEQLAGSRPRIDVADVLRGLAVMGIVLLHSIEHFNFYSYPDTAGQCGFLNFTDSAIWSGMFFAFGGKAYAVFALLFGFSFFIQDDNRRRRGGDFRLRFMWRLVLLFAIGQVNAAFFTGEILVMYSLVGFVLVATCRLPDKAVFWIALVLLLQPLEWVRLIHALADPGYTAAAGVSGAYFDAAYAVQDSGTFLETVKMNLWEGQLASITWAWEHGRIFQTAALFMFGMLIGRRGLFLQTDKNLKFWLGTLGAALVCYFPLAGLTALVPEYLANKSAATPFDLIFRSLTNFAFMLVLVSGVILAFYTTKLGPLMAKIIPYGRMSLTNYLTQSIVGSMLFYNWGFGLHLGITYSLLAGACIFILQYTFCRLWLARRSHGPFEYIWKKATWVGVKA